MLFLLKRSWPASIAALVLMAAIGLVLRSWSADAPPLDVTPYHLLLGVAAVGVVLLSDGLIHGTLLLTFGDRYRRRHRELAAVFRGQSLSAMLAGAALAGIGEELLFRGVSSDLRYLIPSAIVFGLLHHIRRDLWPFTLWALWQGLLFVLALKRSGDQLAVTMTAHFLHDTIGFLVFRRVNAMTEAKGSA